jgi:hypothetical protein
MAFTKAGAMIVKLLLQLKIVVFRFLQFVNEGTR